MNHPSHPHPHPHRRPVMPLVARAAHAATAAYQRAMTSKREHLYQQEIYRLRRENQWLRGEVRHCWDAIDVMGHDLESRRQEFALGELLAQADARRRTAVVDQRHLLEVHLREQLAAEFGGGSTWGLREGVCRRDHAPQDRWPKLSFPYLSPTTNQAPSLEGA